MKANEDGEKAGSDKCAGINLEKIYMFGSPSLYYNSLTILMMAISFYFSAYFCIFATDNPGLWHAALIVPVLFSSLIFIATIKSTAVLRAITFLDAVSFLYIFSSTNRVLFMIFVVSAYTHLSHFSFSPLIA